MSDESPFYAESHRVIHDSTRRTVYKRVSCRVGDGVRVKVGYDLFDVGMVPHTARELVNERGCKNGNPVRLGVNIFIIIM